MAMGGEAEKAHPKEIMNPQKDKPSDQQPTLDQILQSKISNQDDLDKAKNIFTEVQKNFQESINGYIQ
ncbi:MAG: hypothetical protein WCJ39_10795 [bacterium]